MYIEIESTCGKSLRYVVRDTILNLTFWDTIPCNFVDGHQRFAGNNCSHFQSRSFCRSQSKYVSLLVLCYSYPAYPLNCLIYSLPDMTHFTRFVWTRSLRITKIETRYFYTYCTQNTNIYELVLGAGVT